MSKVVDIDKNKLRQQIPKEMAKWFADRVDKVERCVVIFKDKGDNYQSFGIGSTDGKYTNADVLWDLEQFKLTFLTETFEEVPD